ncbi:hypothetical protein [Kangiella sediminilitoris]|uniref:Uncharacterized protein n=1 Tax=Kangiella sediminilitoris TaxID=1144748 RepID=A0A1B3B9Z1_9GAMM|nr:hypothetical protein [Kangiella sediminilitoris]AOE49632.1 hypothetical protein KS2013_910 [Kangiella sediminilitoris]
MFKQFKDYLRDVFYRLKHGGDSWILAMDEVNESFTLVRNGRALRQINFDHVVKASIEETSAITYDVEILVLKISNANTMEVTEEVSNYNDFKNALKKRGLLLSNENVIELLSE